MKKFLSAVLAVGLLCGAFAVQAEQRPVNIDSEAPGVIEFSGTLLTSYDYAFSKFYVLSDNSDVTLETFSFLSGKNFDPFLVLVDGNGKIIAANDDKADPPQAVRDSYIFAASLEQGEYYFIVTNSPYTPVGGEGSVGNTIDLNNIVNAYVHDPLFGPELSPATGAGGVNTHWNLKITGDVSIVPEPETWAMLLAGLGIVGAVARRRS